MEVIYWANDVEIQIGYVDKNESIVYVNRRKAIVISNDTKEDFIHEIKNIFDKHRI